MKFKTTNIKGKEYVQVHERVKYFRTHEAFNGYSIESDIVSMTDKEVVIKSIIKDSEGKVVSTGFAHEVSSSSHINRTSLVENCETSAVGRALGFLGIGIDTSIASFDEVFTAISKEKKMTAQAQAPAKKWLNFKTAEYEAAVKYLAENDDKTVDDIRKKYAINKQVAEALVKDSVNYRNK